MNLMRFLLVEDNEGDILLTLEALKEGSVDKKVDVVRNGIEALQYIESYDPDLILLDVNLPKMNGHEVLESIKKNESKKHIPIVMFTTSTSENDIVQSYENHADSYIAKPVDANDFHRIVTVIENFWLSRQHKN